MKTLGQKVTEFRQAKGWNTSKLAKAVGTSRQNIENLETKDIDQPRYIADLARVMGTTVENLLNQAIATTPGEAGAMAGTASIRMSARGNLTVQDTVAQFGELLAQADAQTRGAVADLMLRYAANPAEGGRIAQAIEVLLSAHKKDDPKL